MEGYLNTNELQSELQQQLDAANEAATQAESTNAEIGNMEHYEKLKEDLAAAQQEVETLRVSASAAPDGDQGLSLIHI